ncbi:MAG: hypothetical protein AB8B83_08615 [Bdellovibrionales bacterium]
MRDEFVETKPESCRFFEGLTRQLKGVRPNDRFDDLSEDQIKKAKKRKFTNLANGHEGNGVVAYAFKCASCSRCVPIRINLAKARLTSNQHRILKKHDAVFDVDIFKNNGIYSMDELRVFAAYHRFKELFEEGATDTLSETTQNSHTMLIHNKEHNHLVGQLYLDISAEDRAINMASHMYDPTINPDASLGTYMWLKIIQTALHPCSGIDYIYPGAWARDGKNLDYKKRFPGLETIVDGEWVDFDPEIHTRAPSLPPLVSIPEIP